MKKILGLLVIALASFNLYVDSIYALNGNGYKFEYNIEDSYNIANVHENNKNDYRFLAYNANEPNTPDLDIIDKPMTCEEILGEGAKLIKLGVNVLRIAGVIIALINGMMAFIPAVSSGDKGQLNAAFKKCINMAIVLILIVLIPELINVIGNLFGWDTSCIF